MDRDEVIAAIRRAFAGVTRGDGVTLHEAAVIDDHGSAAERAAARALDTDARWEEVPGALIEAHSDTLSFVDPAGFRYYLPAYMVWALENFETTESFSVEHAIFSLRTTPAGPRMRDWTLSRFRALSAGEAAAVGLFLQFIAGRGGDHGDWARQALEDYWGRFAAPGA